MAGAPDRDAELGVTLQDLRSGEVVFQRYRLMQTLGRGGMGVVWHARDEELGREVALKFVPEVLVHDPEAIADLKRETNRCLELTHPYIVRIYDFAHDPKRVAISMEYVDGGSLLARKVSKPQHCFDVDELEPLVEQLLSGLSYAHEHCRVVHRDLKPANLMVHSGGKLKIADFGIASTVSDSVSRVSLKPSSGTLQFMGPQQAFGGMPAITDDVYSVGATLYDLITGKPPFYSGEILRQVEQIVPPSMQERRAQLGRSGKPIPPVWEQTVAACLAKEAAQRPQSAREVALRLAETPSTRTRSVRVDGPPTVPVPGPPTVPVTTQRTAGPAKPRAPLWPWLAGAAALFMVGAVALALFLLLKPTQRIDRAERQPDVETAIRNVAGSVPAGHTAKATPAPVMDEAERPPVAQTGRVIVNSVPAGARVEVDGQVKGVTPLVVASVSAGEHRVAVSLEQFERVEFFADVSAGKTFESGLIHLAAKPTPAPRPATPQVIAAPAPVHIPTPRPPVVDRAALARATVVECLRGRANDTAAEMRAYADPVDYYDEGMLNRTALRKSIEAYHRLWPVYSVTGMGEITVAETKDPQIVAASVDFTFEARNPASGKISRGTAHDQMLLRQQGSGFVISRVRETVTDRSKNFR